jgi:hypothetical protein
MNGDLLSLKLHVDGKGEVWYLNGNGPPTQTGLPVAGFLLHPLCRGMPRWRIAGMPSNYQLTLSLFLRSMQEERGIVETCSPMVCKTAADRLNPSKVLYGMRQFERPKSIGGWHVFKPEEYVSYALANQLQKTNGQVDELCLKILKNHPMWVFLSFIPDVNTEACAKLLGLIVDPRWYIDPIHPARGSRLRKFLGLDLPTMLGVIDKGPKQRLHDRCALVLAACDSKYDKTLVKKPERFLWRIYGDAGERSGKTVIAKLRMAQAFIEYLRLCWLAALGRGPHQKEALFVPEHYFNKPEESQAFYDHFVSLAEKIKCDK